METNYSRIQESRNQHCRRRGTAAPFPNYFGEWGKRLGLFPPSVLTAEQRKVAHGATVGINAQTHKAPDGAKDIFVGWISAAPAGA
jgi:hypothetical protein